MSYVQQQQNARQQAELVIKRVEQQQKDKYIKLGMITLDIDQIEYQQFREYQHAMLLELRREGIEGVGEVQGKGGGGSSGGYWRNDGGCGQRMQDIGGNEDQGDQGDRGEMDDVDGNLSREYLDTVFKHQFRIFRQEELYGEQYYFVVCFQNDKKNSDNPSRSMEKNNMQANREQEAAKEKEQSQDNQMKQQIQSQNCYTILKIKLQHQRNLRQLLNFSQNKIIKFSKPILLPIQSDQQQNHIALQISVLQSFLKKSTTKYNQFVTKSQKTQGLNNLFQLYFKRTSTFTAIQQKQNKLYQYFIYYILKEVVKYQDVLGGMKRINEVKLMRIYNIVTISSNKNFRNSFYKRLEKIYKKQCQKIKYKIGREKQEKEKEKEEEEDMQNQNQIGQKKQKKSQIMELLSFNFLNQSGKVGQFFDLPEDMQIRNINLNGFQGQLKDYQLRALHWMLARQGININVKKDMSDTPYWWNAGADLGLKQELYVNSKLNFIVWKKIVKKQCKGGILADEMGLGKTIMMISLILAHKPKQNSKTLIICPLGLVKQWQEQINKFAPFLTVFIVNQQATKNITQKQINLYDIIIVTQGKIRGQNICKSKKQFMLKDYYWFRIVIDQAHIFKNAKSVMTNNICNLNAEYRWCLSGTPIQNSINDIFPILKFLRCIPWCFQNYWQASVCPKNVKVSKLGQLIKLKYILNGIMIRRKKQSSDKQGNKLVSLPDVETKGHFVKMGVQARKAYNIYNYRAVTNVKEVQLIQKRIKEYGEQSMQKALKSAKRYKNQIIWSLINKMRMICCHQFLTNYKVNYVTPQRFPIQYQKFLSKNNISKKHKKNLNRKLDDYLSNSDKMKLFHKQTQKLMINYKSWQDTVREISMGKRFKCLLCQQQNKQQVLSPCLHVFCKYCIQQYLFNRWQKFITTQSVKNDLANQQPKKVKFKQFLTQCPQCQALISSRQLFDMPRTNQFNRSMQQLKENDKILSLLKYVKQMKDEDQALVFTSFLGMMQILAHSLAQNNILFLTIQGNDKLQIRQQKINLFKETREIKLLIFTLKTGSVGLNMQVANKIFFMDPWWNPAVEQQALGRVHRIGQNRSVQNIRFITQQSIQVRVLKRSLSKKQISDMILDVDDIENDKKYSAHQSEIKYLLQMNEDMEQVQEQEQECNIEIMENDKQIQKQSGKLIEKGENQKFKQTYQNKYKPEQYQNGQQYKQQFSKQEFLKQFEEDRQQIQMQQRQRQSQMNDFDSQNSSSQIKAQKRDKLNQQKLNEILQKLYKNSYNNNIKQEQQIIQPQLFNNLHFQINNLLQWQQKRKIDNNKNSQPNETSSKNIKQVKKQP